MGVGQRLLRLFLYPVIYHCSASHIITLVVVSSSGVGIYFLVISCCLCVLFVTSVPSVEALFFEYVPGVSGDVMILPSRLVYEIRVGAD